MITEATNTILGYLTIFGLFIILLLIVLLTVKIPALEKLKKTIKEKASIINLIVVITAVIGSLTYSEIIGWEPCKLCWLQRIFMYPLLILLTISIIKKEEINKYILALAIPGAIIAGYHTLLQMGFVSATSCGATTLSCAQIFVNFYNFITIPFMAFTAFVLIILLTLLRNKK